MSVQSRLATSSSSPDSAIKRPPGKPDDDELEHLIAPNYAYDFDVDQVSGIHQLRQDIRDAVFADRPIEAWSSLLGEYISYGNRKIGDEVAIFNPGGSGHDCVNLGKSACQVEADDCYAVQAERNYPHPLDARRREKIIWTHLDPMTFARAFRQHYERKRTPVTALRINESGDFESPHSVHKVDEIARRLNDIVDTYLYTASYWLPWDDTDHVVINASNKRVPNAHREFVVVDDISEIPEHGIRCPHDASGEIKCGECRLCLVDERESSPDVYVKNFYS